MWSAIKEMLSSKKAIAMIIAGAVWAAGRLGWHVDSSEMTAAISPLLTYILAQGVADFGKGAAQVKAASAAIAALPAEPAAPAA
jgi:hypothetical protein